MPQNGSPRLHLAISTLAVFPEIISAFQTVANDPETLALVREPHSNTPTQTECRRRSTVRPLERSRNMRHFTTSVAGFVYAQRGRINNFNAFVFPAVMRSGVRAGI
jgi:hypothetical protein